VRVVERAEAPRQSEPAVVEVRCCPGWRRLARDEELPCGNSHSTRRFCPRAQLRQIESVSPPTLPNVRKAQNCRVLDGTFAHVHGTSAHTPSLAGSPPWLPRQTVPKRSPKRRRQATFRHSFVPGLAAVGPRVDEPAVLAVGPAVRKSWARVGPEKAHQDARQNQNREGQGLCPGVHVSSLDLSTH